MGDARTETPGAASTILQMLKVVLKFAVDDEWIEATGGWHAGTQGRRTRAWTEEECKQFEARWAPGTMQRRAYALAVYNGQRKRDLVAMARAHRKNGTIRVVQNKDQRRVMATRAPGPHCRTRRGVIGYMNLLVTTQDKAFDEVYFGAWFAFDAAKLPEGCVLHHPRPTRQEDAAHRRPRRTVGGPMTSRSSA
jgi:hypothetical protein